jgi:hypothetical protein
MEQPEMAATMQAKKNGLDPKKLDGVLDRMRDVQTEGDRWDLAEALQLLVPQGSTEFDKIIDVATKEGVAGNLSANTLRLYRDTAVRWPADKRVKNVSFSAHREAMVLPGSIDLAVRMLNDIVKTNGTGKPVTVAQVRRTVQIKQGKKPSAKSPKNATTAKGFDAVADLELGGKQLIDAIGNARSADSLDKLNRGLKKVIGHVEKLQAKAAQKKAPVKPTPSAKAKPNGAAKKPAAKKPVGDLRGL